MLRRQKSSSAWLWGVGTERQSFVALARRFCQRESVRLIKGSIIGALSDSHALQKQKSGLTPRMITNRQRLGHFSGAGFSFLMVLTCCSIPGSLDVSDGLACSEAQKVPVDYVSASRYSFSFVFVV